MTNTELYINGVLCDTDGDLAVRLNRQLLNPAELNTKDAQYSYNISLPPTSTNHRAFIYSNVEETKSKFNRTYAAQLIVNGVRLFVGNFRLTEVSNKGYKGNLYKPALRTVKDIFGDIKLNQNPEYRIPFADFVTSVNQYNTSAANGPQMVIFPYTLYGVLPKVPLNKNANNYSVRTLWDSTVRMGMQDLAPSINPLLMLRHIFQAQGYNLQGTAFDDQKLINLYMSYKNGDSYIQPWNYGQQAKIQLSGSWSTTYNMRTNVLQKERGVNQGSGDTDGNQGNTGAVYACDFLDACNTQLTIVQDTGGNVLYKEVNDADGITWVNGQIRIPASGFYKVELNANLEVYDTGNYRSTDPVTGVQHIGGFSEFASNDMSQNLYEIRLCRDRKNVDFGLSSPKLDNSFYYNNQPQNDTFDTSSIPKYFPQSFENTGQINFVDLAQDKNLVLGFSFGKNFDAVQNKDQYVNPKDEIGLDPGQGAATVLAAKPALSWDTSQNGDTRTQLAIKSPGYWKYGRVGSFDNPGDNPNMDIDYSGGPFVTGQVLNVKGNPVVPGVGNLATRINGYFLSLTTGFQTVATDWYVSDFIDLRAFTNLKFSAVISEQPEAAITAFYDINKQYIGSGIAGPAAGITDTYTNEPIAPPSDAVYVRLSGVIANGLTITGDNVLANNIILHRFSIERWFTYRISTNVIDNYSGVAYVHNGADVDPIAAVPFIDGVAEFSTAFAPVTGTLNLKLTLYLKTPAYDVDGTLTISRQIQTDSEEVVDWEISNRYRIDLNGAPATYAKRGQFNGTLTFPEWKAQGSANAVVWLDAGELITIGSVSSEGRFRNNGMHSTYGWVTHAIYYGLSIQPYRVDTEWLKVSLSGTGTSAMSWNDPVNFDTDSINLVGFLSADIKTDDFIDNFCKAFNLLLSQIDATTFSLNVKQAKTTVSSQYVNLDSMSSVTDRINTPLGLPSLYKLGFTVDVDEEGYKVSGDDGGGSFETGVIEGDVVEQKSFFSYNWFKDITKNETAGNVTMPLAIISKYDPWVPTLSYPEAMRKKYTDQAYRFWYYAGLLNDIGATFQFNNQSLKIARVSNEMPGVSVLNYKNQRFTILYNYFTILINGASHYTDLEGYLTAIMYVALNGSILAMFNGDLYYVAELNGYDPSARNKTKIKLIRKI